MERQARGLVNVTARQGGQERTRRHSFCSSENKLLKQGAGGGFHYKLMTELNMSLAAKKRCSD